MAHSRTNRNETVDQILGEALELPVAERDTFVAKLCGDDVELLAEVNRLLKIAETMDAAFLEQPAFGNLEIAVGDTLGSRFRVARKLGDGGMGCVYLADDSLLGEVAIKTLHPGQRTSPTMLDRLRREIRVARGIAHPNLCPVYDCFELEHYGSPVTALTMKYLAGETLAARLARGPVMQSEALVIAEGTAAGIDALHAEGVLHRDLKPSNLMLVPTKQGFTPVIMDFGLAKTVRSTTSDRTTRITISTQLVGCPDYMAPELFRDQPATISSDIYSLGTMLFETVTGRLPFPKEGVVATAVRRSVEDAPRAMAFAPWIGAKWDAAIASALHRDPARRPSSGAELVRLIAPSTDFRTGSRGTTRTGCAHRPPAASQGRRGLVATAGAAR